MSFAIAESLYYFIRFIQAWRHNIKLLIVLSYYGWNHNLYCCWAYYVVWTNFLKIIMLHYPARGSNFWDNILILYIIRIRNINVSARNVVDERREIHKREWGKKSIRLMMLGKGKNNLLKYYRNDNLPAEWLKNPFYNTKRKKLIAGKKYISQNEIRPPGWRDPTR